MQSSALKASADRTADINYTERSPLVVPPTRDLPPPAAGSGGAELAERPE